MCFGTFLPMKTLCDAYRKKFESLEVKRLPLNSFQFLQYMEMF